MKNKLFLILINKSEKIIKFTFWIYFAFILGYYFIYDEIIPVFLAYLFWFLFGIQIGYLIAKNIMHFNIKNEKEF